MRRCFLTFVTAVVVSCSGYGAEEITWYQAKSPHFSVYSQSGPASALNTLAWFEQLRTFFDRNGFRTNGQREEVERPVRVVQFRSTKEYAPYRLHPTADAYYLGADRVDFIVMPTTGDQQVKVAAHEYAHLVFYRSGRRFPPWLNEGLADFFSSVHLTSNGCELGRELPSRVGTLRREGSLPLQQLFSLPGPPTQTRREADIYYAESWALSSMLVLQPSYAPYLPAVLNALEKGVKADEVFRTALNKTVLEVDADLAQWIEAPALRTTRECAPSAPPMKGEASVIGERESRLLLADLLLAASELERARSFYEEAAASDPSDPRPWAALGTISLRQANKPAALRAWQQAINKGLDDAALLSQFAGLADEAGLPSELVRTALRRAIQLKPNFDDARYRLALLESNAGHYAAALEQLHAVRKVLNERAFGYWTAYAYAATELGQREEAERAASEASGHARNASEKSFAAQLAYQASTDLTVQFSRTADGGLQMITARKPHDSASWNPFIQAQDTIRREEGKLRSVECGSGRIQGFSVDTPAGTLALKVEDPQRVLMNNAPGEFFCGTQSNQPVQVEFAISGNDPRSGYLRGMRFR